MADFEPRVFKKTMVDAAMTLVSETYPEDYKKIESDPSKKQEVKKEAEKGVEEIIRIVRNAGDEKMTPEAALSHLSEERQKRFRQALGMKTFEMKIMSGGVSVTRGAKQFKPTMKLSTAAEIDAASKEQMLSIIVECVILVLEVIGVNVPDTEEEVKRALKVVDDSIAQDSMLLKKIEELQQASEKHDLIGMAKGIFGLVIAVFHKGLFWKITKALLNHMSWFDWIKTAAKIAASIAAIVATGGSAAIAKLVATVVDAKYFLKKMTNLASFQAMKIV